MREDPIVAEVRKVREQLFSEFGYDLEAYAGHIAEIEAEKKKRGFRYASPPPLREPEPKPDAA